MEHFGELQINYLGATARCRPGEAFSFGRDADLVIDENPYLHRVAGQFRCTPSGWIVENVGTRIVLTLRGANQIIPATVPPGQLAGIVDPAWSVSFQAGRTIYEIEGSCSMTTESAPGTAVTRGTTQRFGVVDLTADQRRAVVALAQEFLRGDLQPTIPSNKEIAHQLGWTSKAVQRKVDNLAEKLTQAGVPGLKGNEGASADRRRERIVAHMIRQQLIRVNDLDLLV